MNFAAIRILARQAALWCALVAVVTLLTLLFTVLGTITCSVLVGMMMGAARRCGWRIIPVSLVFPGVVLALVQVAKVELVGAQRILLPALCFGVFWLVYLFTRALLRWEARPQPATPETTNAPAPAALPSRLDSEPVPAPGESHLDEWQGKWIREFVGAKGSRRKAVIEITGEKLSLSVIDSDGAALLLARGELKLATADLPNRDGEAAKSSNFRDGL
jgi:hypothetical protein